MRGRIMSAPLPLNMMGRGPQIDAPGDQNSRSDQSPFARPIESALRTTCELLPGWLGVYFAARNPAETRTEFVLQHVEGDNSADVQRLLGHRLFASRSGVFGKALGQGRTAWSEDYALERDAETNWVDLSLQAVILTPVRDRGTVVGHLGLLSFAETTHIGLTVRRSLESIAARLGQTLEQSRLDLEVDFLVQKDGLPAIGAALESRGLEAAGHTERVEHLAGLAGRALRLHEHELEALTQGAYLHDIGKLAVSSSVQLKTGPLGSSEWGAIQTHAVRGFEMASRIANISPGALEVIYHHHERWDGTGYPDRLAGEAIPLGARVFSVCDVFDTLVSSRPYKRAWGISAALEELHAQSGRQLDPMVVEIFLELAIGTLLTKKDGRS
jgi:HD-GYP domain-containing protein (c-di-GMP phosphodiesterase class II)